MAALIKHNVKSCVEHTGKTPLAVKEEGKRRNLPVKIRKSAKEVLRAIQPEKACCMSMADNLIEQGYLDDKVFVVTKKAETVFKGMLDLGITPAELKARLSRLIDRLEDNMFTKLLIAPGL